MNVFQNNVNRNKISEIVAWLLIILMRKNITMMCHGMISSWWQGAETQKMRPGTVHHFLELSPPELFPSCRFQVNSKVSRRTITLWIHPLTHWWYQNPLSLQKTHLWALHVISFCRTFHIYTIKASPFQSQNLKCYNIQSQNAII